MVRHRFFVTPKIRCFYVLCLMFDRFVVMSSLLSESHVSPVFSPPPKSPKEEHDDHVNIFITSGKRVASVRVRARLLISPPLLLLYHHHHLLLLRL